MNQKKLTIILVPIFILTILWVISNVYHSRVDSTISDPLNLQIIPIEGTFNRQAIERIKSRTRVNPANEINSGVNISETPTPTPEIAQEEEGGSESAQTEPTPTDEQ